MELTYSPNTCDIFDFPKVDTVGLETSMMGLVAVAFETEGTVVDLKTKEPLPFVNVVVKEDGKVVTGTSTDFDGNFKLKLEEGEYEFFFSTVGYDQKSFPVKVPGDMPFEVIELESKGVVDMIMGILDYKEPLIDMEAQGVTSSPEIDGVQLRIQY